MFKLLLSVSLSFFYVFVSAQPTPVIPLMRKIFHENIDKEQKALDKFDKKEDRMMVVGNDLEVNQQIAYALFNKIDDLQNDIELDAKLDANQKIKYLRGINEALTTFEVRLRTKVIKGDMLPALVNAYLDAIDLERKGASVLPVIDNNELEVGEIIIRLFPFQKNVGIQQSRDLLVLKACQKDPERILPILKLNPDISFADSLLKLVAKKHQEDIYTYAQATNTPLGKRIQNLDDPLIKTISKLANMSTGRLYFPFLDNLYSGRITMEEIDKNKDDKYKYYRLLVNTQISYADRLRKGDTPMVMKTLTGMLQKKAVDEFINEINRLHDQLDPIRMKVLDPLNAQELYYLCVMGETEIYTSSYIKTYERIFQRMKNPSSDTLLMSVNFDHFKKFIKMAANYNTLNDFLKRMEKDNALTLMKAFVNGLDKTGTLEDAVDVADSYASISDDKLRQLILQEIQLNYNNAVQKTDQRGTGIYDILNTIFLSMDSSSIDLSAKFGIPGVYSLKNASLRDSAGRVIVQQFFYGDKDGATYFSSFKSAFNSTNWKITDKKEWIEVSSIKGSKVVIYANKPLDETLSLDAKAQADLEDYLATQDLSPTVVIHRGHSYYVGSTIDQLAPTAKVVFLGSCGGYNNINKVLEVCPYAHIIASKQVGSGSVNQPLLMLITETLRQGKDLNWVEMWKNLGRTLKDNEMFEDYVPPHKNLGAIFIMAYNRVMEG